MDTTECLRFHLSLSCIGEGNGNSLHCSCLENPKDGGAWWAAIYGVSQSRTQLKRLSSSSSSMSYLYYLLNILLASLVAQLIKNLLAMQETPVGFLGWKVPWRREKLPIPIFLGFPGGADGKESTCNAGDLGLISGLVGKIPWRRAWQPTPVFFPGDSPWTEEPGGLQSMGLQRVRHN